MPGKEPNTDQLLEQAGQGNRSARDQLLIRHRGRLRRMVSLRMDSRLVARFDPSDVVQEALADAAKKMSDYLRRRPLPFYPWLRQLAWERLVELHRRHVRARKRTVTREENWALPLSDQSALALAHRLIDPGADPKNHLLKEELRDRVRAALSRLTPRDREVLVLRQVEQLSTQETAAFLGVSEGAVKLRQLRALERLRKLLGKSLEEEP